MQAQVVSIPDIQMVPQGDLAACIDSSSYLGQQVTVRGVVVMDGGLAQAAGGRNIWLQEGSGAWSGLDLFNVGGDPTSPDDVLDLVAGDYIEVTGDIDQFNHETEIIPSSVTLLGQGSAVTSTVIPVSDLNDAGQVNQLETGEQWEGVFVEIQNVTVTAVNFFSGGNRVSITVSDADGNLVNIGDRFIAQRLPANGGTFVPPSVGTVYESLKGIVIHSANGCLGGGRGYEIHPFDETHYQALAGPPSIANIQRDLVSPTSSQDIKISADIVDTDGNIMDATLFYAIGASTPTYQSMAMSVDAGCGTSCYSATIPASAYNDGDFVKYYICATDDSSLTSCQPNVPDNSDPLFFTVRDNGLTIYDLQFTPFDNGNSGYRNMEVTVEGVVTGSAEPGNIGNVYIQQEGGLLGWSGIMCLGNTALSTLVIGDKINVTGIVRENFGFTRLEDITNVQLVSSGNSINPVSVDPTTFSEYDFATNEQYEGMLVTLSNPAGGNMYIVNENADDPNNFAEYRVGLNVFEPNNGSRVLAGRQTGSAFGSLNVSFVNDSIWATDAGVMNVPACVVKYQDSLESMTGIMYYSFGNFKILPRNNDDFMGYKDPTTCEYLTSNIEDELVNNSTVVAYPVPVQQSLNVDYSFPKVLEATISLTDLMGRTIAKVKVTGMEGHTDIDMSDLASGTYLLSVQAEGVVISRSKVVK